MYGWSCSTSYDYIYFQWYLIIRKIALKFKQKISSEADASNLVGTGQNEEYRAAISGKLKEYLSAFYEDGSSPTSVANGVGSVYVSPQGQIAIVISFKNLNQNNYWTGGWQSEWTLSVNKKGSAKLEGRIRINVHYFEDGNVQLNSTFNEQGEVDVSVKY